MRQRVGSLRKKQNRQTFIQTNQKKETKKSKLAKSEMKRGIYQQTQKKSRESAGHILKTHALQNQKT